ncbi:LamB/YcsF family protein [Oscillibacter sp. MSJ-2]|uniref:5-oxoprolinase subunit A n=1 Tax=Dysosmobacter acutus TaxID=2841504 RepID=A0ABS6F993_9FIRM|nr:5-oxoprolinase subunit PxpA [Dysosmobacter acutus]MBU5625930.1 LamB/YcsF family protein [Dysosmobacter acutus]
MKLVDLNCDLGESFGAYTIGADEEVLGCVSSANIACGFHAGDPLVMARTVALAGERGTAVGAHPGFPDLMGFGRRNMSLTPDEAEACVVYQIGALLAFARRAGLRLQHVKPHGALYNMAAKDNSLADAIARAVSSVDNELILLGQGCLLDAARRAGLRSASEVFADRAYQRDGTLVPRSREGAVIHSRDAAIARTVRMVEEGRVTAVTGEDIPIQADSICIHGDSPSALEFARSIRSALESRGVTVAPLSRVVF